MTTEAGPAAWLRAAITGRMELAKAATQVPWEPEGDDPTDDEVWIDVDGQEWRMIICRGPDSHENMLHVAANDPRDTIARCETELAILDEHAGDQSEWGGYRPDGTWQERGLVCMTCGHDDGRLGVAWPCRTVRLVFTAYRYWPGYDAAWGEPERAGGMTGTGRSEN